MVGFFIRMWNIKYTQVTINGDWIEWTSMQLEGSFFYYLISVYFIDKCRRERHRRLSEGTAWSLMLRSQPRATELRKQLSVQSGCHLAVRAPQPVRHPAVDSVAGVFLGRVWSKRGPSILNGNFPLVSCERESCRLNRFLIAEGRQDRNLHPKLHPNAPSERNTHNLSRVGFASKRSLKRMRSTMRSRSQTLEHDLSTQGSRSNPMNAFARR